VPFAGIFRLTPEMKAGGVPPNWMPYVEANDVDKTAALATSLGGKVMHGPADVSGAGRFAVLQDPQGAVFGIYKSASASQSWDGTAVLGRVSWHELMTTDYVKAFEFYRSLFGWENTGEMDMGGGNKYLMVGKGSKMYGGMFNQTPAAGMPPFWLLYFHVKDVPKAVATATKAGATLHRGPMDIPGGVIAILGDPQGAGFAVHHVNASAAAPTPATKKPAKASPKVKAKANVTVKAKAKTAVKAKAKRAVKARGKAAVKATKTTVKARAKQKAKRTVKAATRPKPKSRPARRSTAKANPRTKVARKAGTRARVVAKKPGAKTKRRR
jgi:predicted enzyme related to lactoylglutathione lyase